MVKISASLLAADAACLKNEVRRAEQAGVEMFHVDVHADTCPQPCETFRRIQSQRARVGLALNKQYELRDIASLLSEIDLLVIMAVEPGFGGQKFDPQTLGRVKEARQMINSLGLEVTVAVDGGISQSNFRAITQAGAQELIIGSTLFKAADMGAIIRELRGGGPPPGHPPERAT